MSEHNLENSLDISEKLILNQASRFTQNNISKVISIKKIRSLKRVKSPGDVLLRGLKIVSKKIKGALTIIFQRFD